MIEKKSKLEKYLEETCVNNAKFAKKIGVTHTTFMKYVRGTQIPSILTAAAIQEATDGKVKITDWVTKEKTELSKG